MYKGPFKFKPITFSDISLKISYKENDTDKEVITDMYTPNQKVEFYLNLVELVRLKKRIVQIEYTDDSEIHHLPVINYGCGITNLQSRINSEMIYQMKRELSIKNLNPIELNVSFDKNLKVDIFINSLGPGYVHHKYKVYVRKSLQLENDCIAILCDDNLCFGYRINGVKDVPGGLFKEYTVCVYTD